MGAGRTFRINLLSYWSVLLYQTGALVMATLWLTTFSLVVATWWSTVVFGRRRAAVRLDQNALTIRQQTLLWPRTASWPRRHIAAIGPSSTGNSINEFHVFELRVQLTDGQEATFLGGRERDELAWMATLLRRRLDLPGDSVEEATSARK
jgi:hypothetical protein